MDKRLGTGLLLVLAFTESLALSFEKRQYDCKSIHAYNTLNALLHHDQCLGIDKVFQYLNEITDTKHYECRTALQNAFAGKFGRGSTTPHHCECSGTIASHHYDSYHNSHYQFCNHDSNYLSIFNQFFNNNGGHTVHDCRTHHSLWYDLAHTPVNNYCQYDLVKHLAGTFNHSPATCTCQERVMTTPPTVAPTSHPTPLPSHCHSNTDVMLLTRLFTINPKHCLSIHKLWSRMADLQQNHPECLGILDKMAEAFPASTVSNCVCHGQVETAHNPFLYVNHKDKLSHCIQNKYYLALERYLFEDTEGHACTDHSQVWSHLQLINTVDGVDCKADFIQTAARKYAELVSDTCTCTNSETPVTAPTIPIQTKAPTHAPTQPPTQVATPAPTQPPTQVPTQAPTQPPTQSPTTAIKSVHKYTCNKFSTVSAIANSLVVTNVNATKCVGNGSNEGFVLTECNVTSVSEWHKGLKLWPGCANVPWYTPVAAFAPNSDKYDPVGGQSGIFAGCLSNGFRLLIEHCTGSPVIVHIEDSGQITNDPNNYYLLD